MSPIRLEKGSKDPAPTLGGNNGFACGFNNRGEVVGSAENTTPEPECLNQLQQARPVLWELGRIHELPVPEGDTGGQGVAINDLGQAVGMSGGCQTGPTFALHGSLWENGARTDLGNLGGALFTFVQDVNNLGQVVGASDLAGHTTAHAFLWTKASGMQDLGTLPGDVSSLAKGINDKGQIVGQSTDANQNSRAFLWQNGVMTDLNTLVPGGGSTFFMFEAFAINARGQFAAIAFDANTGNCCAFLMTPVNGETSTDTSNAIPHAQISESRPPDWPEKCSQISATGIGSPARYTSSSDALRFAACRLAGRDTDI